MFVGGWTLDAAETVCPLDGDIDVLPCVESLLDKNLVKQVEVQGECRFVMLETIREYALERLAESGEENTIRQQHVQFFLVLAEETEPKLYRAEPAVWVDILERKHENLRAAFM